MKDQLQKFLTVAKAIVYDKKRADVYLPLLETQAGSVSVVANIIAAIEQRVEIPPQIKPILAMNIYLLMVDVAMQSSGEQPDKEIMKQTLSAIMSTVMGEEEAGEVPEEGVSEEMPEEMPPETAQNAPQGLLAQGGV
jgi:hypothetical protein